MAQIDKNTAGNTGRDLETGENPIPRYFVILFAGLVVWAVLFSGYFLFSGWSSEAEFADKMAAYRQQVGTGRGPGGDSQAAAVAADPEAARAEGEKLFAGNCTACHGAAGEGGIGPALQTDEYKYGKDLEAVQDSIAEGRPGGMPAFGNQLSPGQVEALAHFVTTL